jgi:rSAM/selenodomain-associated transferase 1
MKEQHVIIIFAKNPVYGTVKTRLAVSVGNDEALKIYNQLSQHTKSVTESLAVDKIVFYSDYIQGKDIWDNEKYKKQTQSGSDLGERMLNAFSFVFQGGYSKAVIVGTDCPALSEQIIQVAFKTLDDVDVVIGPAFDGGYYLLGLKRVYAFLFENIGWSTGDVLAETINRCKLHHLSFALLQQLHDVDEVKDLVHLETVRYER